MVTLFAIFFLYEMGDKMSSKILAVGSIAYDSVKTWAGERSRVLGGSVTYFSVSASLFSRISVVAVVGEDFNSKDLDLLKSKGVDISGISVETGKTFHWQGIYPKNGDAQTLKTELNVFEHFKPVIQDEQSNMPILFLGNIDPDLQIRVVKQMNEPSWVICDTMNFWINQKRESLLETVKLVDILIINGTEVKMLSCEDNLQEGVNTIMSWGPQAIVVKNGSKGATLFYRDQSFDMPACPVSSVVDPTGAGDTFAGGFVGDLARSFEMGKTIDFDTLKQAAIYGNIMASYTIEDFGLDKLKNVDHNMLEQRVLTFKKLMNFS